MTILGLSVFYIIAYVVLCGVIYLFPKTADPAKKQTAFLWVPVSLLLAECWASVTAGLFSLLHIPVSLLSIGLAHLAAAAALFLFKRKRARGLQKADMKITDIVLGAMLLALVLAIGYIRFFTANPIIFLSVDPAERLGNAMTIAVTQSVITHFPNQYFIQLTGSLFIQTLQPFHPSMLPFRFFELKDLLNWWFTGALFYGAVSLFMRTRFSRVVAFIITFVFVLGYPWMGQLYGFVYPGVATNLILLVLISFTLLFRGDLGRTPAYFIVSLGCFGLGVCYTLYAPPLFLAAFFAVILYEHRLHAASKQLGETTQSMGGFLRKLALTELLIFIIPAIWTVVNAIALDREGEFNVSNSITAEGGIYRNLFTDFLPYAPFVFWLLWRQVTKRKWDFPILFSLIFAVYQFGIFVLMMMGRVSTYYYYKLYFATWLIFLFLACLAVDTLIQHGRFRRFVVTYIVCWALVGILGVTGAENTLNNHRQLSDPEPGAGVSFRIYSSNLLYFRPPGEYNGVNYGWAFIDLCTEARALLGPVDVDEKKRVEIITDNFQDTFWKDALTGQMLTPREGTPKNRNGLWIVLYGSSGYVFDQAYYDSLPRLFENELGFIVKPVLPVSPVSPV
ncbi:hypothetical protein AGMMS49983_16410 [Clostridia bacterium]|nr:hypothetical protein AGMMS49983_16410 [Clostridia bacterium]